MSAASAVKLPWSTIVDALEDLAEAGWTKDDACDAIAAILDETLTFDQVLPGLAGAAIESVDGAAFRALAGLAWDLAAKADPARRAERKAARKQRRLLRKAAKDIHGEVREVEAHPTTAGTLNG